MHGIPVAVRMDREIYERLTNLCESSGMSKTVTIERAIAMLADDWVKKQEALASLK